MCNAWNHPAGCDCGWGGGWNGGGGWIGSRISPAPVLTPKPRTFSNSTISGYTIPNARCPVCSAQVFFYKSPYEGKVFFDALGPPWPKHPCTDNSGSRDSRSGGYYQSGSQYSPIFNVRIVTGAGNVTRLRGETSTGDINVYFRETGVDERAPFFVKRDSANNDLVISTLRTDTTNNSVRPLNFRANIDLEEIVAGSEDEPNEELTRQTLHESFQRAEIFKRFPKLYSKGPFPPGTSLDIRAALRHIDRNLIESICDNLMNNDEHHYLVMSYRVYLDIKSSTGAGNPKKIPLSEKFAAARKISPKWKSKATLKQKNQLEHFLRLSPEKSSKGQKIKSREGQKETQHITTKDTRRTANNDNRKAGKNNAPKVGNDGSKRKPTPLDKTLINKTLTAIFDRFPTLRAYSPIHPDTEDELSGKLQTLNRQYLEAAFRQYRSQDKYLIMLICSEHYSNPLMNRRSDLRVISRESKQKALSRLSKNWKTSATVQQIETIKALVNESE